MLVFTKSNLLATLACALASPAFAQQSQMPPVGEPGRSPFERLDRNDDGVITREEVTTARTTSFTNIDDNRDGFLTREEMSRKVTFRRGSNGRMAATSSPYQGGSINLNRADANRDGLVARAEFDAAHENSPSHTAAFNEQLRNELFAHLDANRDGNISTTEMTSSHGRPLVTRGAPFMADGPPPPVDPAEPPSRRRPNPDTNNDQKVSLAEWLARPDPLFERGDTNNDGRITREEAAAFMRQAREQRPNTRRPW